MQYNLLQVLAVRIPAAHLSAFKIDLSHWNKNSPFFLYLTHMPFISCVSAAIDHAPSSFILRSLGFSSIRFTSHTQQSNSWNSLHTSPSRSTLANAIFVSYIYIYIYHSPLSLSLLQRPNSLSFTHKAFLGLFYSISPYTCIDARFAFKVQCSLHLVSFHHYNMDSRKSLFFILSLPPYFFFHFYSIDRYIKWAIRSPSFSIVYIRSSFFSEYPDSFLLSTYSLYSCF